MTVVASTPLKFEQHFPKIWTHEFVLTRVNSSMSWKADRVADGRWFESSFVRHKVNEREKIKKLRCGNIWINNVLWIKGLWVQFFWQPVCFKVQRPIYKDVRISSEVWSPCCPSGVVLDAKLSGMLVKIPSVTMWLEVIALVGGGVAVQGWKCQNETIKMK